MTPEGFHMSGMIRLVSVIKLGYFSKYIYIYGNDCYDGVSYNLYNWTPFLP